MSLRKKEKQLYFYFYVSRKNVFFKKSTLFIISQSAKKIHVMFHILRKRKLYHFLIFKHRKNTLFFNVKLNFRYYQKQKQSKKNIMLEAQDIFQQLTSNQSFLISQIHEPLLKNQFIIGSGSVSLVLINSHILLQESNATDTIFACSLGFQTKFEVIRAEWPNQRTPGKPLGICIEKENSPYKIELYCSSPNIVDIWAKQLGKKINERNFHKLFKAKRKIGKGAFATVYLAERLIDGKMFAVKAFSKQKQYSGDKGRQSLENQIRIMRALNHPNIMKLQGVYETENSMYVILEYLQGTQLNQQLKSLNPLPEQEIKSIVSNLLKGLEHLASKRIIHRDLKPENIMFRSKGSTQLVICDFGLATHADDEKYLFVRCGTPGFVAPQIINIKDLNSKSQPISDVFAVGVIFHYLLFKRSIFEGKKYAEILNQNRACNFDFSIQKYQSLKRSTLDLLKKLLEKNPEKRISAHQALQHPFLCQDKNTGYETMDLQNSEAAQNILLPINILRQKCDGLQSIETPSTLRSSLNSNKKCLNSSKSTKLTKRTSLMVSQYQNQQDDDYKENATIRKYETRSRKLNKSTKKYKMIDESEENHVQYF